MINLKEYFQSEVIDECTKEELVMVVKALFERLEFDHMFLNEQIINIRWFRKQLEEDNKKYIWKEKHFQERIKNLEIDLAVVKRAAKKKETVN